MGFFNFFSNRKSDVSNDGLKLLGPKYLRPFLQPPAPALLKRLERSSSIQWTGQLCSATGGTLFNMQYFGDLLDDETVVPTKDGAPQRLVAIDATSGESIVLFDKALHGWDGLMANLYSKYKLVQRPANALYKNKAGATEFHIVLVAFYNEGTRREIMDNQTTNGTILLENGSSLTLQDAFDDAYDALVVYAIDTNGNWAEVINEELA